MAAASQWAEALLGGQFATLIAIVAVAFVGYHTMTGRISMKAALRVVLGCFVLFGSSAIAQGLIEGARDGAAPLSPAPAYSSPAMPSPAARPATGANPFDPYSSHPR